MYAYMTLYLTYEYKFKTYAVYSFNERDVYKVFYKEMCIPCMYKTKTQ